MSAARRAARRAAAVAHAPRSCADENLEEAQIKALVELVAEFTLIPDNPAYLVDAMFGAAPALKVRTTAERRHNRHSTNCRRCLFFCDALQSWDAMSKLLSDPPAHGLDAGDAPTLARLLTAAARKATGDVIVAGAAPLGGSRAASKTRDEVAQARDDIARVVGPQLPALFARYAADAVVVGELAKLVPCMALSRATTRSSLKALADALTVNFVRQVGANKREPARRRATDAACRPIATRSMRWRWRGDTR